MLPPRDSVARAFEVSAAGDSAQTCGLAVVPLVRLEQGGEHLAAELLLARRNRLPVRIAPVASEEVSEGDVRKEALVRLDGEARSGTERR
jgi:hypothetical protein